MSVSQSRPCGDGAQPILPPVSEPSALRWEGVAEEVLAGISVDIEKALQRTTDDIYERLLYAVQDNLSWDAKYNIQSRIESADRQARLDRQRVIDADQHIAELRQRIGRLEFAAANASSALNEAAEYFADRADADCDQDGFIPNREMGLLQEMEEAMGALDAAIPKAPGPSAHDTSERSVLARDDDQSTTPKGA